MKKQLLLQFMVSMLFFSCAIMAQDWKLVNQSSRGTINDIAYVGSNAIWITGESGSILKSADGGLNWTEQKTGISKEINELFFVDANTGFAAVDTLLAKTADGGNTWTTIKLPVKSYNIKAMSFVSADKGWLLTASSKESKILATADGGKTWSETVMATVLKDMHFSSDGKGIAAGGGVGKMDIYYTTDGAAWKKAPVPAMPEGITYSRLDLNTVFMVNDQIGYASGWGSRAAGLQPTIIIKTTDGGATWSFQTQSEANRVYVSMSDIYFKDAMNGIIAGGFSTYEGSVAIKTTDGGVTWSSAQTSFGYTLNAIGGKDNELMVVGDAGVMAKSSDFGAKWDFVTEMPSTNVRSIEFPDNSGLIYAAGEGGLFLKSTDYGKTWTKKYIYQNNVCPPINEIFFINKNVGYAVRNNAMISKTIDGGETWTIAMKDTAVFTYANTGAYFFDENTGFVVGGTILNTDAIYKTVDGGKTWTSQIGQFGKKLNAITFFDNNNGIIAGGDTTIAFTKDGGAKWTKAKLNGLGTNKPAFSDVAFLNATTALAVGAKFVLRTTDGGENWDTVKVAGLNSTINSIAVKNQDTAYAVATGAVYLITNAGKAWANIIDTKVMPASNFYYSVAVSPAGYPWVGSSSASIYTKEPEQVIDAVTGNGSEIPSEYTLAQNYPNPFNPSTTIEYGLSEKNFVNLSVYDILGRQVTTLVNGEQNAGTHKVTFNASNLSSGMYLYRLSIDGKTITKTMTLLK